MISKSSLLFNRKLRLPTYMTLTDIFKKNSILKRYYFKTLLVIGIIWTFFDYSRFLTLRLTEKSEQYPFTQSDQGIFILRLILGLIAYSAMAYMLIFPLKNLLRKYPLWLNFFFKTVILCVATALYAILFFYVIYVFVYGRNLVSASHSLYYYAFQTTWLLNYVEARLLLYIITLLILEINEKYSPGVFTDIFIGKYLKPKEEKRIILFIDLKNSTPIAEKLGHQKYFFFIRDFIHHISLALLEYDGLIYQYVGDEVVVSWLSTKSNKHKCIQSVVRARRIIQKESDYYRREYGIVPEYRIGVHLGFVTVGEIGIVKKDLTMSGDAMNTTARIRTMTGELNEKFIGSADFVKNVGLKDFQIESLGMFDLKGKELPLELFAIKI
ncbi:MAG TPA: adenylate/guanylate cyclase domain-containing protein [Chitinophagaceae bacterium]|nr:adenylate/guanylate cyclase domain-containing protein [Chitinophagaceae bacterium]